MDILDQDIERDDNELNNTQIVQLKGFSTSARILGIFFFLLGLGGFFFSYYFILRYKKRLSYGWDYEATFDVEPFLLFGIGGVLALITGWMLIRAGIKGHRDVYELRNISNRTLIVWNRGIIMIAMTLGFVALFLLYLIVKYGID
jgi:hypothetical protein